MVRQFIFCCFFFAVATSLADTEDAEILPLYRVEIIVFQHLYSDELAEQVSQVNDYRTVTRPLATPVEPDPADQSRAQTGLEEGDIQRQQPLGTADIPGVFDLAEFQPDFEPAVEANFIFEVTEQSDAMRRVWGRLLRSPAHEPLHYAGWQQQAYPPEEQNPVRIHDDIPLAEPEAREVDLNEPDQSPREDQLEVPTIDLSTNMPAIGDDGSIEDLPEPGESAAGEEEEIDEAEYTSYRLDGQLSLVQRKFLHLDLDIEWRELVELQLLIGEEPAEALTFSLYTVLQRRQVLEDRLEYFDTPWLGAITLITEIELPEEPEVAGLTGDARNLEASPDAGSETPDDNR